MKWRKALKDVEKRISNIKETNKFIIPSIIRQFLPETYHFNVFLKVKDINRAETVLVHEIKSLLNMYRYLQMQNNSREKSKGRIQ